MFSEKTKRGFSYSRVTKCGVYLCAEKENVHAGVEPEHAEDNGSKAAVNGGIIAEVIYIE